MYYDRAQTLLETYVQDQWSDTAVQYDNVPFNSDLYREFVRCTIVFGEGSSRTITNGCYRQVGLLLITVYTKPSEGTARLLELATLLSQLLTHKVIKSTDLPLLAINLKVPDMMKDVSGRSGWVMAQLSFPFYYDLEMI